MPLTLRRLSTALFASLLLAACATPYDRAPTARQLFHQKWAGHSIDELTTLWGMRRRRGKLSDGTAIYEYGFKTRYKPSGPYSGYTARCRAQILVDPATSFVRDAIFIGDNEQCTFLVKYGPDASD